MSEPRGFGRTNPNARRPRAPLPSDLVDMAELGPEPIALRIIGDVIGYGIHKVKIKKRDGSETMISKPCLAYDPESDSIDSTKACPYCELETGKEGIQYNSHTYYVNAIIRSLQETAPRKMPQQTAKEKKTGIKEMDSSSWTPVRVLRVPSTLATRLKKLGERNFVINPKSKAKKAFDANHPKFGFDIEVAFDKDAPPANMYSADRIESPSGEKRSPLTEEELAYLVYDINNLHVVEELKEAKAEAKSLNDRWYGIDDSKPSKRKPAGKSRARDEDDDDGDDDDMDDDEDFDLNGRGKSSKSKAPAKSKRSSRDDDDDMDDEDDDSFDDLDDDEEDEPPRKPARGASKKPAAKSKRRAEPEDEDEDDDGFDDDDDEEDEPPRRKAPAKKAPAKKPAGKRSSRDEDEDEDDDGDDFDDLDDDEEDEPPRKPARGASKKPAAKSKRTSRKDEDEDFDDDDIPF